MRTRALVLCCLPLLIPALTLPCTARAQDAPALQTHPAAAAEPQAAPAATPAQAAGFDAKDLRAWAMLKEYAAEGKSPTERIQAMAALGTMGSDPTAAQLIEQGMKAHSSEVRSAAVLAAGQTHNPALKPRLEATLDDEDAQVAYTAAVVLWRMHDDAGQDLIEAVAVGDKKVKPGLIKASKRKAEKDLHSPKTMALLAVNGASGYFLGPFGIGIKAIEYVDQNKSGGPRAAAVDQMAEEHSDNVRLILIDLLDDKETAVRAAAAKGLGRWSGDETARELEPLMKDDKLPVRLTAAAAFLRAKNGIAAAPDCRCDGQ